MLTGVSLWVTATQGLFDVSMPPDDNEGPVRRPLITFLISSPVGALPTWMAAWQNADHVTRFAVLVTGQQNVPYAEILVVDFIDSQRRPAAVRINLQV